MRKKEMKEKKIAELGTRVETIDGDRGEKHGSTVYACAEFYFLDLYAAVLYHYAAYGDLCSEPLGSISFTEEVT